MNDETTVDIPATNDGELTEETVTTTETQESSDPLDALSHDELLARAKGYRAERDDYREGKRKPKVATPAPSQFITRSEVLRSNTLEAKTRVTDEVRANWDKVIDYVPAKYRGATAIEDIAKAMTLAHRAFLAEHPPKADDPAATLATDAGITGGSQTATGTAPAEDDGWGTKAGPENWFKQ